MVKLSFENLSTLLLTYTESTRPSETVWGGQRLVMLDGVRGSPSNPFFIVIFTSVLFQKGLGAFFNKTIAQIFLKTHQTNTGQIKSRKILFISLKTFL